MRGFTLVELAIVIVIAGILTAIAVPIYRSLVDGAKVAEAEAGANAMVKIMKVQLALVSFEADDAVLNGVGITDMDGLTADSATVTDWFRRASFDTAELETKYWSRSDYTILEDTGLDDPDVMYVQVIGTSANSQPDVDFSIGTDGSYTDNTP